MQKNQGLSSCQIHLLTPGGKDPISNLNKSMVTHQYSCYCKASYIGLTTRHLRKRIKGPRECRKFSLFRKEGWYTGQGINASKRSSIAEHLVNNSTWTNTYNLNRFKITNKTCSSVFDSIK